MKLQEIINKKVRAAVKHMVESIHEDSDYLVVAQHQGYIDITEHYDMSRIAETYKLDATEYNELVNHSQKLADDLILKNS